MKSPTGPSLCPRRPHDKGGWFPSNHGSGWRDRSISGTTAIWDIFSGWKVSSTTAMKSIMINAREQVAKLLELKEADTEAYYRWMLSYKRTYCRQWER